MPCRNKQEAFHAQHYRRPSHGQLYNPGTARANTVQVFTTPVFYKDAAAHQYPLPQTP
jgi:hypothetical protein